MSVQVTESNIVQQNEDINATPVGSKEVVFLGKRHSVPAGCDKGFGTWHPNRPACNDCPLVTICFCKKSGTPLTQSRQFGSKKVSRQDTENQRRKKAAMSEDKTQGGTPAPTRSALNPFKVGSKPHQTRELLIKVAERNISKATTDELEKLYAELGLVRAKSREDRPNLLNRQIQAYVVTPARKGGNKAPSANHAPLHGLVTMTGSKPNFTFEFNIEGMRAKLAELEAAGVQPAPSGGTGAADDGDEDDDD